MSSVWNCQNSISLPTSRYISKHHRIRMKIKQFNRFSRELSLRYRELDLKTKDPSGNRCWESRELKRKFRNWYQWFSFLSERAIRSRSSSFVEIIFDLLTQHVFYSCIINLNRNHFRICKFIGGARINA